MIRNDTYPILLAWEYETNMINIHHGIDFDFGVQEDIRRLNDTKVSNLYHFPINLFP